MVTGVNGDWFPPQQSAIDASSDEGETPDDFVGNIQFSDVIFHYPARPDVQVYMSIQLSIGACGMLQHAMFSHTQ